MDTRREKCQSCYGKAHLPPCSPPQEHVPFRVRSQNVPQRKIGTGVSPVSQKGYETHHSRNDIVSSPESPFVGYGNCT